MIIKDIRNTIPVHATRKPKQRTSASCIVVHTTASNNQDPNKTALYHITPGPDNRISKAGAPTICYHDFITKSGIIYHCVDYTSITWHAGLYNTRSVGVVMAFTGQTGESPTQAQYDALEQHLVTLCLYLKILPYNVIGHREVPGMYTIVGKGSKVYKKTCPGMGINLDTLRHNITGKLQQRLIDEGLYVGKVDYNFGPKSHAALFSFEPLGAKLHKVNWEGYNF